MCFPCPMAVTRSLREKEKRKGLTPVTHCRTSLRRVGRGVHALAGCAVVGQFRGRRVKRPRCGAPSLCSPLAPAGSQRPAMPSNQDNAMEPPEAFGDSGRRDVAEHGEFGWDGPCCDGLRGVWGCARHGALPFTSHGEAAPGMPSEHGWCGLCCTGTADLEGNHTPPILARLEWFCPLYARHGAGGSTALPACSALLFACPPGRTGGGKGGGAPHLFAGKCR
jgi:hypothetical protein